MITLENEQCPVCSIRFEQSEATVYEMAPLGGSSVALALLRVHPRCADKGQRATDGLVDSWLVDDKPTAWSTTIRLMEIASVESVVQREMNIAPGRAFLKCMVPRFYVSLRGGQRYVCGRVHTASLIGGEERTFGGSSKLGGTYWSFPLQHPESPSVVATEKFRGDLIIAWAESIKDARR